MFMTSPKKLKTAGPVTQRVTHRLIIKPEKTDTLTQICLKVQCP